jgi:hypothetical protein
VLNYSFTAGGLEQCFWSLKIQMEPFTWYLLNGGHMFMTLVNRFWMDGYPYILRFWNRYQRWWHSKEYQYNLTARSCPLMWHMTPDPAEATEWALTTYYMFSFRVDWWNCRMLPALLKNCERCLMKIWYGTFWLCVTVLKDVPAVSTINVRT